MSAFYDLIEEYLGDADSLDDIRVVVRRCYFYDFDGIPIRLWQGQGTLFTTGPGDEGEQEWLGTIDSETNDHHETPAIQDGRDGSSAQYNFGLTLIDIPGQTAYQAYNSLKEDQALVFGRRLTIYLAVFQPGENVRPTTPIVFFKQLIMQSPTFSEKLDVGDDNKLVRKYRVTIKAKDANFGRSNTPNGTYADTIQKQRAKELGVDVDKGSEFLALLANRTFTIP